MLDIPWRLTHLLLSLDHSKNTATNIKFTDILLLYTGPQADFIPLTIHYFFSYFDWTNRLQKYQYTIKRGKTVSQCWWQSIRAIKGTEQRPKLESTYQLWQSTLEHRSCSSLSLTRRDSLQHCWRSKAALKLKSSTIRCCWDTRRGTCNFEASLHRAPTNCPLFWLPRGNA